MEKVITLNTCCSQCRSEIQFDQKFCTICGFPEKGTEHEQSSFHAQQVLKRREGDEASKKIKKARNSLFVISGFSFLVGIFYFFKLDDSGVLIASTVLAVCYLFLGFWSQKKPLVALVLGLLVYLTVLVLNGILEPETIYKGIVIKIFIIGFLANGINSALQLRNSQ